MLRVKVTRKLH